MSSEETFAAVLGIVILIYGIVMLVSIGIGVLQIISMWKLFEKAGEPNWSSIIPVYNYIQMIKIAIGNYKLAWVFLILWGAYFVVGTIMGIAGGILDAATDGSAAVMSIMTIFMFLIIVALYIGLIVVQGYLSYMFPKSYGKSTAFCVLSIFFFPIMVIIMGFDKSTMYVGPKGIPQNNNYFYQNRF